MIAETMFISIPLYCSNLPVECTVESNNEVPEESTLILISTILTFFVYNARKAERTLFSHFSPIQVGITIGDFSVR